MAPMLYSDSNYSLTHLIEEIKHGKIGLPSIQRPFVWKPAQVRDLFDSMYRGYPVGTLMFWETGADVDVRQIDGGENDPVAARQVIVDGQQRLTSLFAVITGRPVFTQRFQSKRIRIAFCPKDETFAVTNAAVERDPEYIADITELWAERYRSKVRDFLKRLSAHRGVAELDDTDQSLEQTMPWSEERDMLEERVDRVHNLRDFRFQVLILSVDADEEQVADIFVRINSKGMQLKRVDFLLTLMSIYWDKGRQQLEQFSHQAVDSNLTGPSPRNAFIDPMPDQLLRVGVGLAFRKGRISDVYKILRGRDLESGEVSETRRTEQFRILADAQEEVLNLDNWHEFLKCLIHAGFRSSRMVTSNNALIYTYVLWLIGRRDIGLDLTTLRSVIARWFFMAHTTGRYTGSYETQIESDLRRLSDIGSANGQDFCQELDRLVRATFTHDYWKISLPNKLDTSSAKSPVLSAYQAALVLLDAKALFSGLRVRGLRVRDLLDPAVVVPGSADRRHLFPKAHLATKGITGISQVNAIANMAYVDSPENGGIDDDAPSTYWPEMKASMGKEQLEHQVYWHALPVGWEQLDYPMFLEKRRSLMAKVVQDGFNTLWENKRSSEPAGGVADLLAVGESQTVEFKSTARWDIRTEQIGKWIEHAIAKTVCGFLNAEGGKLLIGVDDDGNVVGLEADLATLSKKNRDGYELFLRQMLDNNLSVPTAGIVRISFERIGDTEICVISVSSSSKPVFCKPCKGSSSNYPIDFWVRTGNATQQLHGDAMLEYRENHWDASTGGLFL